MLRSALLSHDLPDVVDLEGVGVGRPNNSRVLSTRLEQTLVQGLETEGSRREERNVAFANSCRANPQFTNGIPLVHWVAHTGWLTLDGSHWVAHTS